MPSLVNYAGILFQTYCYEFYKIKQFFLVKKVYIFLTFPTIWESFFLEKHPKTREIWIPNPKIFGIALKT